MKMSTKLQQTAAAAIALGTITSAALALPNWRWQPHYDTWSPFHPFAVTSTVRWTDKDGLVMGDPIEMELPYCTQFFIIPAEGAEDVKHNTWWTVTGGRVYSEGRVEAPSQKRGTWTSDMTGFYSMIQRDGVNDFEFRSGFVNEAGGSIYWSVDVFAHYAGRAGRPDFAPGTQFDIVNGLCDQLPGYLFSTTEIGFSAENGLALQGSGFTGALRSMMEEGICPTPGSWALVALAAGVSSRRRR